MSITSVLITGANRGLGLEFVRQFLALPKPPVHIFASCRNTDKATELQAIAKKNSNVKVIKLDVKDVESFSSLRQQLELDLGDKGLNLLLNNAGILFRDSLEEVTKETMMENFEVNVVSPLLLTKELLPLLKTAASKSNEKKLSCSRAAVVNITSKMGSLDDNTSGGCYPYRTSKTALNMVSKSLSVDLKPHGILTFVIHPGWVLTDMGGKNALITPETSVGGMIDVIVNAKDDHCGNFFNYDGKKILW
ncbi:C-factor-like [Uloborus diversus]|uniref:C-factor-like n=1 Tax=Uloborus diversus TaxID=327109 RepID=UPI00240A0DB4|nr:C-factor-like [Uloborus diversus]